jgi:hypothetical protein
MKEAFFNYLSLGGVFSEGLMALLSGLNPDPVELGFPLLCHACLCCWPLIASIFYTKTHVYCG